MGIEEIRDSGLLELYVLGDCTDHDRRIVEESISAHNELKKELSEIARALEAYAYMHRVEPSPHIKDEVMRGVSKPIATSPTNSTTQSGRFPLGSILVALSVLTTGLFAFLLFSNQQKLHNLRGEMGQNSILCDSLRQAAEIHFATIRQLQNPNNKILTIQATPKYADTRLILIVNEDERRNFVQVHHLPVINDQQSFQLWSLKPGQAPIPMNVFQGDEGNFIPVDYEGGTATYAITIEARGGVQSPTLENLIGTVNISS